MGQRYVDQGGAQGLVLLDGFLYRRHHRRIAAGAKKFLGQTDAQAGQRLLEVAAVIFRGALKRGGVALVKAGHGVQHQRAVFGGVRHDAALVEGGSVGHHAVARNHAVAGFQAGEVAHAGRLADGTAGIGGRGNRR